VDAIPIPSHVRHRGGRHLLTLDAEPCCARRRDGLRRLAGDAVGWADAVMMWRLWIILPVFLVAALFLRFDMHPNPWAVTAAVTLGFFFLCQLLWGRT
jgi:hypothetical protein